MSWFYKVDFALLRSCRYKRAPVMPERRGQDFYERFPCVEGLKVKAERSGGKSRVFSFGFVEPVFGMSYYSLSSLTATIAWYRLSASMKAASWSISLNAWMIDS